MGNIYQKRNGRSWMLRKQSLELWPKWIKILQEFNKELHIEKPLIQLTTNDAKFEKLKKFVKNVLKVYMPPKIINKGYKGGRLKVFILNGVSL